MTKGFYLGICVAVVALGLWFGTRPRGYELPDRQYVTLPRDYQTSLVHYATVDRSDQISRNLYISPEALEALRQGEAVPERTLIVIEAFEAEGKTANGRWKQTRLMDEIHAAEMRTTWRMEDLQTSAPDGNWNFAAFATRDQRPLFDDINDCFSCHDAVANSRDFVFSAALLRQFIATGEVQYQYCPRPDREICR